MSPEEETGFSTCIPIIEACKQFLSFWETRPYSIQTFPPFKDGFMNFFIELEEKTQGLSLPVKEKLQRLFRSEIYAYLSQSTIASRALTKPLGYPGDYVMLHYLYENKVCSKTDIGCYLDQFFLEDTLAKAVVNRVNTMSKYLDTFIANSPKSEIHILDIASGSGFDLLPIAQKTHPKKVVFHCFDQELASLLFVKNTVGAINKNTQFQFYKEDIKQFFKKKNSQMTFDLVYNIGLADYLPDRLLKTFMQESIHALNPGGEFILAHKDFEKFFPGHPAWLYSWHFIQRNYTQYLEFIHTELTGYSKFETFFESEKKVIYFGKFVK